MALPIAYAQTSIDTTSQKTQSFVEAGGFISYIDLTRIDERYSYEIDFSPPDGVSKLLSSEIIVKGDFPPSSLVTITLNGQPCVPREWTTPASDKKILENYEAVFECVDNAKERTGKWALDFSTNAVASNVRLTYKNKYYNNWNLPEVLRTELGGTLTMHGTEYIVGDRAKVWLQAVDALGQSVDTAACYVDIYYPHGTKLIDRAPMNFLEDGIYFYDLIVPNVVGVYPATGLCYYSIASQEETADVGYVLNGTVTKNTYTATVSKNNVYWEIEEALASGIQRITFGLNYTSVPSLTGLAEVDFDFEGRWNGGTDVITMYFYNWTSATWQAFPNTIPDTGAIDLSITNSIATSNATISGIRQDGNIYIQFRDSSGADATKSKLKIDYMAVNLFNLSGDSVTEIKGSSEIHAKAELSLSSKYLDVQTTCGKVSTIEPDGCGSVVNLDDFMNYLEGEIEVNITVTSLASENETLTEWVYQTPITQDCTSIYYILHYNGTGWEDVLGTALVYSMKENENCHVTVPLSVGPNQIDYYRIIMDNYMLWEIQWTQAMANVTNASLSPLCTEYAFQFNYTYTVPITEDTFVNRSDNQLFGCHRFFDDQYYINYYSDLANQAQTVVELTSYYIEVVWYQSSLRHNLQFATFNYAYNDFLIASAQSPSNIWNYPNRTLTDYNQTKMWQYLSEINTTGYDAISMINNVNISIGSKIDALNQSIYSKLNSIQIDIFSVNASLYGLLTNVNASIQQKLSDLDQNIFSVNQTLISTYNLLGAVNQSLHGKIDSVNSSIFQKLYSMQSDLANIYNVVLQINNSVATLNFSYNDTALLNYLSQINLSIYSRIEQVNQSLTGNLYSIQADLSQMNSTMNYIYSDLLTINSSVHSHMDEISQLIGGINQSIITELGNVNVSIFQKLSDLDTKLDSIYNLNVQINGTVTSIYLALNMTALEDLIKSVNQTINSKIDGVEIAVFAINQSIMTKLYALQGELADVNSSIYGRFGQTDNLILSVNQSLSIQIEGVSSQLVTIQNDIADLYNLLSETYGQLNLTNQTIMNKLYLMQTDLSQIYQINVQINDSISKISMNTTALENLMNEINASIYSRIDQSDQLSLQINQSIMNKLYLIQDELADVNSSIHDRIGQTDNLILSVNGSLYNQIIDLKGDVINTYNQVMNVYSQVNATNQSIMNKLYLIQDDLANIYTINQEINATTHNITVNLTPVFDFLNLMNQSVETGFTNTQNSIYAANQSVMNKLYSLQDDLANLTSLAIEINDTTLNEIYNLQQDTITVYNSVIDVFTQLNLTNQTVMNKLYPMQDDLASIYSVVLQINNSMVNINVNMTPILTFLLLLNGTITSGFMDTTNLTYAVNQSIMDKLYLMQSDLADIYGIAVQINDTSNNVYTKLDDVNQSINNAIFAVNNTIMTKLYMANAELLTITDSLINLTNELDGANTSIHSELINIRNDISSVSTQITDTNASVMNKLYLMQDEISSVNNTVISTNGDVLNNLYIIQSDLDSLLNNLTMQLANASNMTINITANLAGVADDVWELFFVRGTPPLAPSTDYYCHPDNPNILVKNITYNYLGDKFSGYFTKTEDLKCSYGCVNGTIFSSVASCDQDPTTKSAIGIVLVVIMMLVVYYLFRSKGD